MNPVVLKSQVVLRGKDFFGRNSELKLSPARPGSGWLWKMQSGNVVPLTHCNVRQGMRQIQIGADSDYGNVLHIFEHIGFLRCGLGLFDVIVESSPWPPYFGGRGRELLSAVKDKMIVDGSREIKWYTLSDVVKWKNERGANIEVVPSGTKSLGLNVMVDYAGYGKEYLGFDFPDQEALEKISSVYTQGWPPSLFYLSLIASKFGWPHHNQIVWPQKYEAKKLLVQFARHRTFDLLGALCLVCKDGLLSAKVFSSFCGHKGDLAILPKIARVLCPLQ